MYRRILVPVDGSEPSMAGLAEALQLAKIHGSNVYLLHIVHEFIMDDTWGSWSSSESILEGMRQAGEHILASAEQLANDQGIRPTRVLIETIGGVAADTILEEARKLHADLIVMGTHGRRGLARLTMGSDAEQVLRGAQIPVLLIRSQPKAATPATEAAV